MTATPTTSHTSMTGTPSRPWVHIDIAGTAQLPEAGVGATRGATGFGSRLLVELACAIETPAHGDERAPGSARARRDG
jgi:hypothetical protein